MRNRNVIAPAVLITVGLLALLVNLGAIPTDRLYRLADLWPVLLIVLGLVLLVNRARFPPNVEMAAAAAVVLIAVVGAAAYVALGPAISTTTQSMTASAPVAGLTDATLEVDAGASSLDVESSNTGLVKDLFQAQITYSGPKPSVSLDRDTGRVVIRQDRPFGFFGKPDFHLNIQLNVAVRWSLSIHTGASKDKFVLIMQLREMEIDTGASTEDITLPDPRGTVPIRVNGGALTVNLHRPAGADASVKVSGGAVTLNFDGRQSSAVGSVQQSSGNGPDIFEVSVNGGTCHVTMDQGPASG